MRHPVAQGGGDLREHEHLHLTPTGVRVELLTAATAVADYVRAHLPRQRTAEPHSTYAVSRGWYLYEQTAPRRRAAR